MTCAVVAKLDECGRVLDGYEASSEFKKLKERGVAVLSVSVSGLRFSQVVESQFLDQWNTTWLAHARNDQNRIERLNSAYAGKGRQKAALDHALALSQAITEENPTAILGAVKTLLRKTQNEIKTNERLLSRMRGEVETLDELVKWIEIKDL